MRILIADDDYTSRLLLAGLLRPYGECVLCANGKDAADSFARALAEGEPFGVVCLDIMMPEMDGQTALARIRAAEQAACIPRDLRARVVMTTALDDRRSIIGSFREECDFYLTKPINRDRLSECLSSLGLSS